MIVLDGRADDDDELAVIDLVDMSDGESLCSDPEVDEGAEEDEDDAQGDDAGVALIGGCGDADPGRIGHQPQSSSEDVGASVFPGSEVQLPSKRPRIVAEQGCGASGDVGSRASGGGQVPAASAAAATVVVDLTADLD